MVIRIVKAEIRVNKPKIRRREQKNSAKVAKVKLKAEPTPNGSGKCSYFSEKEESFRPSMSEHKSTQAET